ncbi:polysaccharide deacetylase family protein [Arthrobacter pityocampae]|uniref:polysaccharide deacetylase family protein n=1 Tax=Arthrobacter pityocampae TaxID=547334 RepID=UPI003735DEBE
MERRSFISAVIAGSVGLGLAACARAAGVPGAAPTTAAPSSPSLPSAGPSPMTPTPTPLPPPPAVANVPLPAGVITGLHTSDQVLAWTVDDGSDSEVIRRYLEFARTSGTRLTFFLNGCYPGWSEHATLLQPLVDSGQIQLGNHTWSHADLTSLDDAGVVAELQRNHDFIVSTFGVDPRPYYRPPYGYRDARTDAAAASIGYTSPVMWYGSLADSEHRPEQEILGLAGEWFLPAHIVIGHLNFLPVTRVFPQLEQLLADRGLTAVTLDDVFQA